jgi:hypothetical protein
MKPFITIMIFAVTLLAGCKQQGGAAGGHGGSTIDVPKFSITITLDEPASNKLKQAGETIKGAIYFDGDGTPQPGVKTAPMRDVILGSFEFELEGPGTLKIDNASISAGHIRDSVIRITTFSLTFILGGSRSRTTCCLVAMATDDSKI